MKNYEFYVIYVNGHTEHFYCMNFKEAIIRAMNYAYDKAWNTEIDSIEDEDGNVITDIEINYK